MLLTIYLLFIPFFGDELPQNGYEKGVQHYRLAYEYASQNNLDKELDHYLLAHEYLLSTDSVDVLISVKKNLGSAFRKANNPVLAIKYYDEALLLSSDIKTEIGLKYNKARALKEIGRYEDAIDLLIECDKYTDGVNVRKANIHNEIGLVLVEIGQYDESRDYFYRLINASPQLTDSSKYLSRGYHNIGHSFIASKDYKEAVEFQTKAVRLRESIGGHLYLFSLIDLAESYHNLGEHEKSLEASYEAISNISDNIGQFRYLDAYRFAYKSLQSLNQLDQAIAYQRKYEKGVLAYYNSIDSKNLEDQRLRAQRKYEDFLKQVNDINKTPNYVYWLIALIAVLTAAAIWRIKVSRDRRSELNIIRRKLNSI